MNAGPPRPPPASGDHEHVGRISTQTTIFVLIVIAVIVHAIQWILLPFMVSGLLAYVCTPVVEGLTARTGAPRSLFVVAVFLILVGIAVLIGLLGLPPLIGEFKRLLQDLQGTIETLAEGLIGSGTINLFGQPTSAAQLAQSVISGMREWVGQPGQVAILGGIAFASMFGLILTVVLLFYFLLSGPRIMRGLLWLVPPAQRPLIRHIWSQLDPVLKRYFVGVIIVVCYATVAAYVGLGLVLGIHHAVFLALLTGILEMIPVVGPLAAAVIAGLIAVRYATSIGPVISFAIYATALRLSIDQLFGPLALGTAARVHPVLIIFCFLSGGILFGITGVIMAVPVALIIKTTLTILYDDVSGTNAKSAPPLGYRREGQRQ
jgi:predicted PurR-regulated permease PerM